MSFVLLYGLHHSRLLHASYIALNILPKYKQTLTKFSLTHAADIICISHKKGDITVLYHVDFFKYVALTCLTLKACVSAPHNRSLILKGIACLFWKAHHACVLPWSQPQPQYALEGRCVGVATYPLQEVADVS